MPRLAWSVYSSKDFAETKTVTGDLFPPDPEYSQQDPYDSAPGSRTLKTSERQRRPQPRTQTRSYFGESIYPLSSLD
ncbi:hypothetical protein E6H35_00820 [Candidatus Bathyarchaeota archaeon]|nr:MAG: hypothetical protein E6H35_00820 [Candidatus Bathyarchaeota archaeon]